MNHNCSEVDRVVPNAISAPPASFLRRVLAAACALLALGVARATPTISITTPTTGSSINVSTTPTVTISANTGIGSSPTGTLVSSVNFLVNGTSIGSVGGGAFGTCSTTWTPTATGSYTLTAVVTDTSTVTSGTSPNLNTATSPLVIVTVTSTGTTVTLTNPANATSLGLGAAVALTANATAPSGATVSRVDFLSGTTVVGSAFASPYAFTWTPSVAGTANLTARVTDSTGFTATSATAVINITIPTVTLTSPLSGAGVTLGATVSVVATAAAISPATVSKVDFLVGTTVIGTATASPYSVNWIPSSAGPASITARVTDSNGAAITTTAVNVTVAAPAAPVITLSAPLTGAVVTVGNNVALTATATPVAGTTIAQVQFLVGATVVGTVTSAPYTAAWIPAAAGNFSVTARVVDSANTTVTSAAAAVTAVAATSVNLSAATTATVGTASTLTANAAASTGATITSVAFFANGVAIGSPVTTAPYTLAWTPAAVGTVALTARATDSLGVTAVSNSVSAAVSPLPPAVTLITPQIGAIVTVGSPVSLTATATPGTGATVAQIQFLVGSTIVGTVTSAPYAVTWIPTAAGNQSLTARVTDSSGASAVSSAVGVTVVASAPTAVAIIAPAANSTATVGTASTLTASASAVAGATIVQVAFFANGVAIGSPVTTAPYTLTWTPTASGAVLLTARATDSLGTVVTSPAVPVTVADNVAPILALTLTPGTAPATTFPAGATRYVLATATPSAGRAIVRVEFFIDGTKVGEKTSPTSSTTTAGVTAFAYTYKYTSVAAGSYALLARATDNAGLTRDATLTLTVVTAVGTAPTAVLISPANGATAIPGTAVSLAATASAPGGSVANVQFYANGLAVGNPAAASPYIGVFNPPAAGTYVIEAVVTDDRGNTTVSNAATITAAFANPTVALTAPTGTAITPTRVTPGVPLNLTATATGGSGATVLLVEFYVGGAFVGSKTAPTVANGSSYTFAWTPTTAQLGVSPVTARVTDTNSLTTTSNPAYVNVVSVTTPPPVVNNVGANPIPATFGLQTLSTVNFVATVAPGNTSFTIASVEFFLTDGVNALSAGIGARETSTGNLYRLVYNFGGFDFSTITPNAAGAYPLQLFVIARDNTGVQTQSGLVNLTVNPSSSAPPTILTQALGGTTIAQGNPFQLIALPSDTDGAIASIQLYANGVVSGAAQLNPTNGGFSLFTFTPTIAGTYRLFVVATDDTGNTAISGVTTVTVTATAAPVVAFVRPSDNTTITTVGAPTYLEATVTLVDQTLTPNVQFTVTGGGGRTVPAITATRVSATSTTYRGIFTNATADTYTIGLTASVANGTISTTSPVSRTVQLVNAVGNVPSVALTNFPGTATTASTISLLATATDGDGFIASVEFFLNRLSLGLGTREQLTNLWRLPASFAGLTAGNYEVQALARDNAGNAVATAISTLALTTASSAPPTVAITATPATVASGRSVTLTATAQDSDGTVVSVTYFANGTAINGGALTNAGPTWSFTFTPSPSGAYNLYALATDNTGNTALSPVRVATVRPNNPLLDDDAFINQTFSDLSNSTPSTVQLAGYDAQLAAGTLTRAQLVSALVSGNGTFANTNFNNISNALVAYWLLMGEWPTTANYTTLFNQRGNLANVCNTILNSPEYAVKFSSALLPTAANFNANYPVFTDFTTRLWRAAGLGGPSTLDVFRFQNNDTSSPTLGRGYVATNVQTAIAEFITLTNSGNTALINLGRTAALYYQLDRPTVLTPTDAAASPNTVSTAAQVAARITALTPLADLSTVADAVLKDLLYAYRYVTITRQPQPLTVSARSGAIFSVDALGAPPISYQWLQNGAPIAGATAASLYLTSIDTPQTGNYSVVVTTSAGSTTSDPALLTLSTAPTRLGNISSRGFAGNGANVLTAGFVVTGTGTKPMLIRVVGPSLASLGISGFLPNPNLTVINSAGVVTQTNDNWGTQSSVAATNTTLVAAINQATARVGAFALPANSLDAVVLATLSPGSYTVQAGGAGNSTGVAIIEVYDASVALTGPKAINVSTRAAVGTGENILIAGFVVNGTVSRRVLIRGVGPTLRNFGLGINSLLPDPQLKLLDSSAKVIATNDDWASGDNAPFIAAAATAAGAFPLANGSKDSSILIMLPPGAYTAQLSGAGATNNTGIGLIEVYDVDP